MSFLKRLVTVFSGLPEHDMVRQLGGKVARQCHSDVWIEVTRKPLDMSLPMLRGYVRAHSLGIIAAETEAVATEYGWDSALCHRVAGRATEQVVQMVVQDFVASGSMRTVRAVAA